MKFNNETLRAAVKEWLEDDKKAEAKYGHISNWDVSNVTVMHYVFYNAKAFNQPIGNWDVSNVTVMRDMFYGAKAFNQPIGNWDVSKVTNMMGMFERTEAFNQPIGNWDVSKVTNMINMFSDAQDFNQPIGNWDVSNITVIEKMFYYAASFNQPIGDWDVSQVANMNSMFRKTYSFNQPIGDWDVSKVTNMMGMFEGTEAFNQPLNNWDVSKVTSMVCMFDYANVFNQPLDNWDVSNVTDMRNMFYGAKAFNQPIDNWRLFTPLLESTGINLLKLGDKLLYQKFSDKLNKQHFLTEYYRKNDNKIPNSTGVICYSDLRQKTIDLLIKNKNLRICLESMTNSYSYVPITTTTAFDIEFDAFSTPIPEEYISEIAIKKALSDEYGSFGELSNPITFGRKITPEDILNLQKTSMFISVFQDVTGWFIDLVNEFDKDDIETLKEILDDYSIPWNSPINMNILYENFSDKGDLECYHLDVGGLQNIDVEFIGYTIDSDFGITSKEMMTDDMNWRSNSNLFFYNKP